MKRSIEINSAEKRLLELGLFPHQGLGKSWDSCRMIKIISNANRNSRILDVGCHGCPILPMLKRLGFTNLYGCDYLMTPILPMLRSFFFTNLYGCDYLMRPRYNPMLVKMAINVIYRFYKRKYLPVVQMYYDDSLNLSIQNLEKTSYRNSMFDYITSLSVVEHGVDLNKYFREMSRLLKRGGYLLTSTDYWPEKVTHTGTIGPYGKVEATIGPYGKVDNIFCRSEIEDMIELASKYNLNLIEPMDYTHENKLVRGNGLEYTFIFFAMRKK